MTTDQVVFTPTARLQAHAAVHYIAQDSSQNAVNGYAGLEKAIRSLEVFPHRFALAPESKFLGEELRQCIHHSHRIIYRIEEQTKTIRILHVRHGARRSIGESLEESGDD